MQGKFMLICRCGYQRTSTRMIRISSIKRRSRRRIGGCSRRWAGLGIWTECQVQVISDNLLRFDETIRRMNSESSLLQTQIASLSRFKLSHVSTHLLRPIMPCNGHRWLLHNVFFYDVSSHPMFVYSNPDWRLARSTAYIIWHFGLSLLNPLTFFTFFFSHTLSFTIQSLIDPIPFVYNVQINPHLHPPLPLPHFRLSGTYANEFPPS